jgi:long-chain acyl-CoA synthetase
VKPTSLLSVPLVFNRVYDGVMKKIGEGSALSQKVAKLALATARRRNARLEQGLPVPWLLRAQYALADKLVLGKIKARICPSLKYMIGGGAATGTAVLHFFEDIGIPVCEGYGLTETSPIISVGANGWSTRRLGCVGTPLDNVTVQILDPETGKELPADSDGEICVAGPSVMTGEYLTYNHFSHPAPPHLFFYLSQATATTPRPTRKCSSTRTAKSESISQSVS